MTPRRILAIHILCIEVFVMAGCSGAGEGRIRQIGRFNTGTAYDVSVSGSMHTWRISNFMLWQAANAHLAFLDCYWPDVSESELENVLQQFTGPAASSRL